MEEMEWMEQEFLIEAQKAKFWDSEIPSRMRNAEMTPKEEACMKALLPTHSKLNKVALNFGWQQGTKSAKEMLHKMALEKAMVPGQFVSPYGAEFSLCKHIAISGINCDLRNKEVVGRSKCFCLPNTALMPMGCIHSKKPLVSINFWPLSLCPTCSECARCKKFLGETRWYYYCHCSKIVFAVYVVFV